MRKVVNLDKKRVCDMSSDKKTVEIRKKDCVTKIHADTDGTLLVVNERQMSYRRKAQKTK